MKKSAVIFAVFLVILYIGATSFVWLSPDFVKPQPTQPNIGADGLKADIWEKDLDDLEAFLIEQGVLEFSDKVEDVSEGVATAANSYYVEGFEIYWWDVDNLEEGSAVADSYNRAKQEGTVVVWENVSPVILYGPFALYCFSDCENTEAIEAAFDAFCLAEDEVNAAIWDKRIDDLENYLVSAGVLTRPKDQEDVSEGVATAARSYYADGFEIYWWDVENLEAGSAVAESYNKAKTEGYVVVWEMVSPVTLYGPFAIHIFSDYEDPDALQAAFDAFCRGE